MLFPGKSGGFGVAIDKPRRPGEGPQVTFNGASVVVPNDDEPQWITLPPDGEFSASFASRAELLTPEIERALAERLGQLPKSSVGVVTLDADAETIEFAQAIIDILAKSDRLAAVGNVTTSASTLGIPAGRIVIESRLPENRQNAEIVRDALVQAGIPGVEFASQNSLVSFGPLQLIITPR
jgi:hypothetical protein